MKLFKIHKHEQKNYISYELNIPFTKGQKWIEFSLDNNVWFDASISEIYQVPEQHKKVLGSTDSRTIFTLAFRIPFRKQSNI